MNHKNILLITLLCSTLLLAKEQNPFDELITDKIKEQNSTIQSTSNELNRTTTKEQNSTLKIQKIKKYTYNQEEIAQKLNEGLTKKGILLHKLKDRRFLKRLYQSNNYAPLWINSNDFGKKVSDLFRAIDADLTITPQMPLHQEYLYLVKYLKDKDRDQLHIELKLSQLYLNFLKHTLYGRINWKQFYARLSYKKRRRIYGNWIRYKAPYDLTKLMLKENIKETIQEITPRKFGYPQLQKALQKLLVLKEKGGWQKLPPFKRLKIGDLGDNVLKLRERLKKSGDLKGCEQPSKELFEKGEQEQNLTFQPDAVFDICLDEAVKRFQRRHGLKEDGIVGSSTIQAMNQTVEEKIQKVLLNLDRIKWLPRDEEKRYLVVNIPDYTLHYIEDNQEREQIKVIVGDRRHPTPIFHNQISFVVLNPYWKIPEGIIKREIIPAMIKNPNYLREQGLEIHENWSEYSPIIEPESIYWQQYQDSGIKFPYRIMQPPGKKNALGRIKFKFPNRFDVYLHDTPTKYLFKRNRRAFSHGCIRISQPKKLLQTIATFNKEIDMKKAERILRRRVQKQINISQKLPISIIYLTAGFNTKSNELEFRNDIYQYDKMQNVDKY
jgi:murein L,D-transpeptidase YcbB/YkuD